MTKILFLVPPNLRFDSFVNPAFNERTVRKKSGSYGSVVTDMPLGVLSLSAYLKKHAAVETRLVDFNIVLNGLETFEYTRFLDLFQDQFSGSALAGFSPDIVAISTLFSPSYANMLDLATAARRAWSTALIVAGGGVPTNMYAEIFRDNPCFDALCFGEGERPLLGLVAARDRRAFLRGHSSWITREKVENKAAFRHDLIEDLDEIPFLDYGLLDVVSYRKNAIMSLFPLAEAGRKSMSVMTSRGCPHRCCFCSSHTVHGRKMRY
ncbi:MAG: cobalamin B12-binding domain-containing protein, partial [Legionella sp.]|nr:cobalamin B12-binding domain-containing protein [Legionella sp.]